MKEKKNAIGKEYVDIFWLAVDSRLDPSAREAWYVLRDYAYGLCHARRLESAQRGAASSQVVWCVLAEFQVENPIEIYVSLISSIPYR